MQISDCICVVFFPLKHAHIAESPTINLLANFVKRNKQCRNKFGLCLYIACEWQKRSAIFSQLEANLLAKLIMRKLNILRWVQESFIFYSRCCMHQECCVHCTTWLSITPTHCVKGKWDNKTHITNSLSFIDTPCVVRCTKILVFLSLNTRLLKWNVIVHHSRWSVKVHSEQSTRRNGGTISLQLNTSNQRRNGMHLGLK